jgi:hypothetical protein
MVKIVIKMSHLCINLIRFPYGSIASLIAVETQEGVDASVHA